MKNTDIYEKALKLLVFSQNSSKQLELPAKVNFYLMKNIQKFISLSREMEECRDLIMKKYGTLQEDNTYKILKKEDILLANQELDELMELNQDVDYKMIPLSWLGNINFTIEQMDAISFMIDENE